MKKVLLLLFCCILCFSAGCRAKSENPIVSLEPIVPLEAKGTVVSTHLSPFEFVIITSQDEKYGFITDENTELVWKNSGSPLSTVPEYDDWDPYIWSIQVTITYSEKAVPNNPSATKHTIGWYNAEKIIVTRFEENMVPTEEKPVIYLYPTEITDVSVKLELDGRFTCTYPEYGNGWNVAAHPNGTLTDAAGMEYNYLYWEGITEGDYDFSEGFCIAGKDTDAFLEDALSQLGLTRREANEFIVYWLPMMQENAYNVISFQRDAYTDHARLDIAPSPDTLIRVFMAWYPSETPVDIPAQTLNTPERNGFCAVEWGGAQTEAP